MHCSAVCLCSFPHLLSPHPSGSSLRASPPTPASLWIPCPWRPGVLATWGKLWLPISVQDLGFATGSLDIGRLSLPGSLHIGPHGRVEARQPAPGMSNIRCLPLNRPCGKPCSCPRADAERSTGRNKQLEKSRVTWGPWPCCFHSHPISSL